MHAVTVTEAETRLNTLLDEVTAGGEVVITRDGVPVARLSSIMSLEERAASLKPIDWEALDRFRESMPPWPRSSAEMIREMRDEGY